MPKPINGIILTAAKVDDGLSQLFGDIPPALIPVNGKPLIFHQIENFIQHGVTHVYISVCVKEQELKNLVSNYFDAKVNLEFVSVDATLPPGNSLVSCLNLISKGSVIINLGDTFLSHKELKSSGENVIYCHSGANQYRRWSKVKIVDGNVRFFEKDEKDGKVIIGVYQVAEINSGIDQLKDKNCEITEVLQALNVDFKAKESEEWLDFGHLDKYQSSKKRMLEARSFNSLEFNDLLGTITKRSTNVNKFIKEIEWQLSVPKELKVISPRIIKSSLDKKNPFVEMEYYSYPTVSEIWLYSSFDQSVLKRVFSKTFRILLEFLNHKRPVTQQSYEYIYKEKTRKRLQELVDQDELFAKLFQHEKVVINGKTYNNWSKLKDKVLTFVDELYNEHHNCFIHGDFCFSNILFDINSGIVRLIDPRGIWGESMFGDIKYDVAKLRHSIHGDYDFIVHDLFDVEQKGENEFNYRIYNNKKHAQIKEYFDGLISESFNLKHIQLIEGLLFLSMLPLHKDKPNRQKIMLCKAIENLNSL